jgi:hypothetical protein
MWYTLGTYYSIGIQLFILPVPCTTHFVVEKYNIKKPTVNIKNKNRYHGKNY